jgi:peptidoglycan/LPS O-acetylase OafA/YrhL
VGIGRISYGLYLYHMPIIEWLEPSQLGWTAPVRTLQVAGLSLAVAIVSYFAIERPCLRLKSRLRTQPVRVPAHPDRPACVHHELKPAA